MKLEKARTSDFEALKELYRLAAEAMEAAGLRQWHWGEYPSEELLRGDLRKEQLYVVREEGAPVLAVALTRETEPEYEAVNWLYGADPGSIHRFAVLPAAQGRGLAASVLPEIEDILRGMGCDSLHFDTNEHNTRALALYRRMGLRTAGWVRFEGTEGRFPCFEKPLTADCPLLPLRMHPAYRGGSLTPWGGSRLRAEFGKDTEEEITGESLEVSCIPGLESTTDSGEKLPELIAALGKDFAGKYAEGAFPLLLKLIDAREALSVQVHPDNAYAAANEHGKLGKTEAWLILEAPEGSQLVYGIRPGTTLEELSEACSRGAAVEPLLRRVDVRPGDVCFIPAGTVHAIGAGILLYEIQQSSDVTYRFYDWDRKDAQGRGRQLHLRQALDVTNLDFRLDPIPAPDAPKARVLDEEYFTLDLLRLDGEQALDAPADFALLTLLDGEATLRAGRDVLPLRRGESLYIPAKAPRMTLSGRGRAAVSMPR